MLTRRLFIGALTSGALAPVASGGADLSAATPAKAGSRRDEIAVFRTFAEATHPRGPAAATDLDWRMRWEKLAAESDRLSDGAYFHRLRRALGWFRDGHTTVLPFEFVGGVPTQLAGGPFRLSLPLRLRVCHDGVWVVAAGADASTLLGRRVNAIGRMSVPELIHAFVIEWPGNEAWAHRWSAGALASPAFLQALGAIDAPGQPIEFEAGATDRTAQATAVRPRDDSLPLSTLERHRTPRENWSEAAGGGNYVRVLDDGVCYVSLDDMDDIEGKTFEALTREVFAQLEHTGTRRIILDLRRNGGGNNYFGEALRKGIGRSKLNRPGGLYVLIGPQTFSAAQNLVNRLERETFALFIGEPTGGSPNHYGDAKVTTGEVSGLTVMVSTLPWFDSYPQDQRPWIFPDLLVPDTFAEWQEGRDAALAAAIEHRTSAAPDELSRERIFYFRRTSQQGTWEPFWR
jgi:hypothetical protein